MSPRESAWATLGAVLVAGAWLGLLAYVWCMLPWQGAVPASLGWAVVSGIFAIQVSLESDKRPDRDSKSNTH